MKQLLEDWLYVVLPYIVGGSAGLILGILIGTQL